MVLTLDEVVAVIVVITTQESFACFPAKAAANTHQSKQISSISASTVLMSHPSTRKLLQVRRITAGRMSASPEAAKADAEDVEVAKADEAVDMRDAEDDKDNEPNGVDRSPSPRPRSASPARSVSRSPVDRSPVSFMSDSLCASI